MLTFSSLQKHFYINTINVMNVNLKIEVMRTRGLSAVAGLGRASWARPGEGSAGAGRGWRLAAEVAWVVILPGLL